MSIIAQMAKELMDWNDKMIAGYEPSDIEKVYLEGLRKQYLALLANK